MELGSDSLLTKKSRLLAGIIFINDMISPGHSLRIELLELVQQFPNIPF